MGENRRPNIKEFLDKILSSKKPLQEIDSIDNPNLAALLRRKYYEEKLGVSLSAVGSSILDFAELEGKQSYKPVGALQIPITILGPLTIEGHWIRGEKHLPIASIYPALVKALDLSVKLIGKNPIRIKPQRCWFRLFTATKKQGKDICELVENTIKQKYGASNLRFLCYGRGGGHVINTIMVGEPYPCNILAGILLNGEIDKILEGLDIVDNPILAPYLAIDYNISTDLYKSELSRNMIKPEYFIETYNAIEDLRPIDSSINPTSLGALASLYIALGIKPEYGLRTEIRQFLLYTRFRRITTTILARIIAPIQIRELEMSIMNRELLSLVQPPLITPFTLSDLGASIILLTYIGVTGSIAESLSRE